MPALGERVRPISFQGFVVSAVRISDPRLDGFTVGVCPISWLTVRYHEHVSARQERNCEVEGCLTDQLQVYGVP